MAPNCYLYSQFSEEKDALYSQASTLGIEFEENPPQQIRIIIQRHRHTYSLAEIIQKDGQYDVAIYTTSDPFALSAHITLDSRPKHKEPTPIPLVQRMLNIL